MHDRPIVIAQAREFPAQPWKIGAAAGSARVMSGAMVSRSISARWAAGNHRSASSGMRSHRASPSFIRGLSPGAAEWRFHVALSWYCAGRSS
jgi:hypothetical protein